jgi:hypothetical protein
MPYDSVSVKLCPYRGRDLGTVATPSLAALLFSATTPKPNTFKMQSQEQSPRVLRIVFCINESQARENAWIYEKSILSRHKLGRAYEHGSRNSVQYTQIVIWFQYSSVVILWDDIE